MNLITIQQAADILGIGHRRMLTLVTTGRVPGARMLGNAWVMDKDALKAVRVRKNGRPKQVTK